MQSHCPSLQIKEQHLIDQLLFIEDAQERMGVLLDQARRAGGLDSLEKTDPNRVPGCVSRVWVIVSVQEGKCRVRYDAESPMVKALVGVICRLFDGAATGEVPGYEPQVITRLHWDRELSPTRLNGLRAVIAHIKSQVGAVLAA